ncbi:MAG: hypothetical protein HY741_12215 [Chloroflexi bacterium]|nr:hypothetical protein [Chloroflexota bacterium]
MNPRFIFLPFNALVGAIMGAIVGYHFEPAAMNQHIRTCNLRALWSLFQKTNLPEQISAAETNLGPLTAGFSRIRCPSCGWRPTPVARWVCTNCPQPENFWGGCGTVWNTFTTQAVCPGCGHSWRWTICPRCNKWSLHQDWYVKQTEQGG